MKLKRIDILGFKSFPEKTSIHFSTGISAIVGPNGCGKSNVVDAVRWVMGEQSVIKLRGKNREDIIFNGSGGQAPKNLAEVSLTLLNDNGTCPEEFKDVPEIMVTRRLYRSGETAYMINKQNCRLKDILNLFLGSGAGPKTYAVIEQGNIGAITEAGPDERRYFIEEVAGITRYKNQKKEALKKIELTNQDLLRISDIIEEVKRQMLSLNRQAKKAERYNKLRDKIKTLEILLAIAVYDDYTQKINETEALLTRHTDTDIEKASKIKMLDARIEAVKLEREEKNREIGELNNRKYETLRQADKKENDLVHLKKEADRLTDELDRLEQSRNKMDGESGNMENEISRISREGEAARKELEDLNRESGEETNLVNALKEKQKKTSAELDLKKKEFTEKTAREARYKSMRENAENNKASIRRRLKRMDEEAVTVAQNAAALKKKTLEAEDELNLLKDELEEQNGIVIGISKEVDEKKAALSAQVKKSHEIELELKGLKSRYSALKKMSDNLEWYQDGVKSVLKGMKKAPFKDRIKGVLADVVTPEKGFSKAAEGYLGDALQYILVDDLDTGIKAAAYLKDHNLGRCGFIPVNGSAQPGKDTEKITDGLYSRIHIDDAVAPLLAALPINAEITEDLEAARNLVTAGKGPVVTPNGDMITKGGIVVGGSAEKLTGILSKKRELADLKETLDEMEIALSRERSEQYRLESDMVETENRLQNAATGKREISRSLDEQEKTVFKLTEELKHMNDQVKNIENERERLMDEEALLEDEIEETAGVLEKINGALTALKNETVELTAGVDENARELEKAGAKLMDLNLRKTQLNAKVENDADTLRRLTDFKTDFNQRREQNLRDIKRKSEQLTATESTVEKINRELKSIYDEVKLLEQNLETLETAYYDIDKNVKEKDGDISRMKTEREEIMEKTRALELTLSEQKMRRDAVASRIEERYHKPLESYRDSYTPFLEEAGMSGGISIEEFKQRLEDARRNITKLGDVNHGAIREYEELKERHDFLNAQREDLVKAVEDLERVIRKINGITREKFMEAFNAVNAKLSEVFPKLFEGGEARLTLTRPDNPLETGVEFMVRPPGKKITTMTLMSGGEKALSAISFIFSIFLIKPASFCLMDEIDAPLDDVNVFRFNNLLRIIGENSQIIMVTHNKRSMEFADILFGVTMEKKGVSKIVSVNLERN